MQTLDLAEIYMDAMSRADMQAMKSLWTDDFVLDWVHDDAYKDSLSTPDRITEFWPAWLGGFSEHDYEVTRTVSAETLAVIQWTFTGTHDRPIGPPVFSDPLQPRHRTIRLRGVTFLDILDGKISKETIYLDLATLFVELGVDLPVSNEAPTS